MIELYTDGAARGNPGPGGYGVVLKSGPHRKEISDGFELTTNNRMELLAVIEGLKALKKGGSEVTVFSDSSYVCDAVNKGWLFKWELKNFSGKKNIDLWSKFLPLYRKHKVKMVWIKGHAGHIENERCDYLAVEASKGTTLKIDRGYNKETELSLGL